MSLGYSENVHRQETVERLIETFLDTLREFIRRATASLPTNASQVDFISPEIGQEDLEEILAELNLSESNTDDGVR